MDNDEAFNAALDQLAAQMNKPGVQEWLAIRKEAGQKLDPETADVTWWYAQTADPYGVCAEFPAELDCVGREYFARSGGSKIWVQFSDLPDATVERLRERIEAGDFDKSDAERIGPLTVVEQVGLNVMIALGGHHQTNGLAIEEYSQLPDGRFRFILIERPLVADSASSDG